MLAKSTVPQAILNPRSPLPPEPIGQPYVDAGVLLARGLAEAVDRVAVIAPAGPYLENQPWSAFGASSRPASWPTPSPRTCPSPRPYWWTTSAN
ncbi:hypothetical protein [Nocardia sp. NPDC019255]|uniref:hypothetical protein n=1 Tax=Nocardia sp. NPDC019255 TaxID=3154591 RepID=UPI0033E0B169